MDLSLRNRAHIKINYLPFAFALPFFGYLLMMCIRGVVPFSDSSVFLYSDSYYQYYPFFKAFREALLSGDSLLYSWNVGMGMDYLGLISYYLASPLNLLVVLVPEGWTLQLFTCLIPLRLGLASLFFAIFLKRMFGKNDPSIVAFGCLYGTCAWALGYQWNLMWLDTFALLPLVTLGTIALLRDKKFILYTITLFLSIFSNYYIGFFICIFVLLLFICYQICNFTTPVRFLKDLGRIALFSALAIGMTAILELPALAALSKTVSMSPSGIAEADKSILEKIPKDFRLNIVDSQLYSSANTAYQTMKQALEEGDKVLARSSCKEMLKAIQASLANGYRQVVGNMGGGLTPTFVNGLPNLYCGVGTIYLAALFLTAPGIKLREKLCSVLMLMFLILSFLLRSLDYIWHGFHFPNQIPYRFSFLYSFVLLYMAYRAYLLRHKFKPWQMAVAAIITCALLCCSNSRDEVLYIVYNGVFLILFVGVLCYGLLRKTPPAEADRESRKTYLLATVRQKRIVSLAFCVIMVVEFAMNLANFGVKYPSYSITSYPKGGKDAYSIVSIMEEIENRELFYRAETSHCQLYNDGAMLGYNGISTFSSSADVDTTKFLQALGLGAQNTWNRYAYEETSPVTNLFLNLKYMIERTRSTFPNNAYFDPVYTVGEVTLVENNAYLPLGFLAESQLANTNIVHSGDRFGLQNQLLTDATGIAGNVWLKQYGNLVINSHNVEVTSKTNLTGTCRFKNGASVYRCTVCAQEAANATDPCAYCGGLVSSGVYVTYTYTAQHNGLFCIDLMGQGRENIQNAPNFTITHNGAIIMNQENTDTLTQILSVCDVAAGDTIEIKFLCNQGQSGRIHVQAAILDESHFRMAYDVLAESTLRLTSFSNTFIEGVIDCKRSGLLYTSIPDNGNWVAQVDGKDVPVVLIGNAMVGVSLTEGMHTVTFRYVNKAFNIGWKVSLLCLAVFAALAVVHYKKPTVKGKYQK